MRRRLSKGDRDGGRLLRDAVNVLLEGWGGEWQPDPIDPFAVFFLTEDDFRQAWRINRRSLLREAQRRGIAEPWGLRRYDEKREETDAR